MTVQAQTHSNRNLTIDAVRGAAILLVMFGHVLVWNNMTDGFIYDMIKVVQMPLFIMVSGYLSGMGRHVSGLSSYGKMVGKRAAAYLIPFFVWIPIKHPKAPLKYLRIILFDLDEGLWFLMTLFLLTAMVYTAQLAGAAARKRTLKSLSAEMGDGKASGKDRRGTAVFWLVYLALTALVLAACFFGVEFLSPGLTRLYIPFYMAGYLAGEHKELIRRIPSGAKNAVCAASWVALVAMAALFDLQNVDTIFNLARQIAASFIGCAALIRTVGLLRDGRVKRLLARLGGYTLEIYTVHYNFAAVLYTGTVYSLYSLAGVIYVIASFAVMSVITAVIIVITKKFWLLDLLLYGKTAGIPKK